jgi:TRAP-type mannitol/chloroaromatic compound transport system permease large subunit
MGPILGTGGLAMIIPPSALGVLLAAIAEIDVGRLLVAGFLPGIVLACLYAAMITYQLLRNPGSAPAYHVEPMRWTTRIKLVVTNILPMGLVVFMVIGFIVLGIATPTEAAASGVLGVIILAAAFRTLTFKSINVSLEATVKVAAMVFFIIMNSTVFSQMLAFSGASKGLIEWVTSHSLSDVFGFDFARHVYGCDIHDADYGSYLLPARRRARFRSDLVWIVRTYYNRDGGNNTALWATAIRYAGGCAQGNHPDRSGGGGIPFPGL